MTKQIIECVPNYSEGRDMAVVKQITDAIESVKGVRLLDVDPGEATNRTVVTFVGSPDDVVEAAFRGAAKAAQIQTNTIAFVAVHILKEPIQPYSASVYFTGHFSHFARLIQGTKNRPRQ